MQNNKPTEVVYDASNCLVLLYTVKLRVRVRVRVSLGFRVRVRV